MKKLKQNILGIFLVGMMTMNAYAAYMTCPPPKNIFKVKDEKNKFTGIFATADGWRSKPLQDFQTLYRGIPKNFPGNTRFIRATIYKDEMICEYRMNHVALMLTNAKPFKPFSSHWHSGGFSVSDPNFEIFECGLSPQRARYDVQYCKFLHRK